MMKRGILLVVSLFLLGACALPVPVQLASWAMDGISIITTHKSVADHGLSLIADKDCAMWRVVEGGDICSGNDAGSTTVAAADIPEDIANFETASGPAVSADHEDYGQVFDSPALPPQDEQPLRISSKYTLNHDPSEFADAWAYIQSSSTPPEMPTMVKNDTRPRLTIASFDVAASGIRHHAAVGEAKITPWYPIEVGTKIAKVIVKAVKPSKKDPYTNVATIHQPSFTRLQAKTTTKLPKTNVAEAKSRFYFVIGSFSKRDMAFSLAAKHLLLRPKVAISRIDGDEVNRVAVGPFTQDDKDAFRHRVRKDGIFDAWAARINPAKWSLLPPPESSDLAQLPQ